MNADDGHTADERSDLKVKLPGFVTVRISQFSSQIYLGVRPLVTLYEASVLVNL